MPQPALKILCSRPYRLYNESIFSLIHSNFSKFSQLMEKYRNPKWEAQVTTTLTKAKPHQIFPLFIDFFNLHKYFPNLPTCYGLHGSNGEPGCIRYCGGFSIPSKDNTISWSKEKLVDVDYVNRSITYELLDSNIGFESYVSRVKVVGCEEGCVIEWWISLDPVEGSEFGEFVKKYEVGLELMAKKMEALVIEGVMDETDNKINM